MKIAVASVLAVACGAACGDNLGGPHIVMTDAPVAADAPRFDARLADGPMPDAMPGPSRVWVGGDWTADGDDRAGMFVEDAMLPVVPAIVVPPGADELAAGDVVDLSSGGSRMVYVAVDASGGHALYVADGDGANAMLLHAAPAGAQIVFASISPDALRVVFAADEDAAGMFDLYLVAAAGGPPFQLTPDRVVADPALDVHPRVAWSRTSRWVAFTGELTEAGYSELFISDTSAPPGLTTVLSRADITTAGGGALAPGAFDGANDLWFAARVTAGVELFRVSAFGGDPIAVPTPARADTTASDAGAIAIAPDGAHVAFAADAPLATAFDVYYAPTSDPSAAIPLTTTVAGPGAPAAMAFAPDGTRLAVIGDLTTPGVDEPYVLSVDGGSQIRLVALAGNQDALALGWNSTSTALFCAGDLDTDGDAALYRLDPSQPQTPTLAVAVPPNGDITHLDVD
jgi:hypothetical protein